MEASARYLNGVKFSIECGRHVLVCDQPAENGGDGAGPSPPDLLLASLAACAAYYALRYLQARSLPTEGLMVRVTAHKASPPPRLDAFRVELRLPALDERHREGVLRAVKSCLIHNTLTEAAEIETVVDTAVTTSAT
ncbi:MAG: OsmC family protein [Bryobacterales bacterium]|nr:OsmC family protein [Bryobacteraceae bacterium]MDW8354888.1 OsmC family protein [Bryobacterales bacterium]